VKKLSTKLNQSHLYVNDRSSGGHLLKMVLLH